MSSLNKEWATRDLVLHFGGSWVVENSKKNGTLYKYEGGRVNRVDGVADFSISFQTLADISKISFPEICMKTLNCYYLVDGVKILIDCDDDLKFQWETLPPDCNGLTHYYLDAYAPTESILSPTPPKTTQTSCLLDLGGRGATAAGGRGANPTGGRGANPTVGGGRGTGRGGTLTIPLPPPTRVQVPQRKKVFKPPRQNYIP